MDDFVKRLEKFSDLKEAGVSTLEGIDIQKSYCPAVLNTHLYPPTPSLTEMG